MPCRPNDDYIQRWDRIAAKAAAHVSELGDRNKEVLLTPLALEWLGDIEGREVLDAGCDDFVRKPFRKSEVLEVTGKGHDSSFWRCDGVRFEPGAWLYADEDGILVSPGEL